MDALHRFLHEDDGATLIEYAFLAAFIGLAAIAGMTSVGQSLDAKLGEIQAALS